MLWKEADRHDYIGDSEQQIALRGSVQGRHRQGGGVKFCHKAYVETRRLEVSRLAFQELNFRADRLGTLDRRNKVEGKRSSRKIGCERAWEVLGILESNVDGAINRNTKKSVGFTAWMI